MASKNNPSRRNRQQQEKVFDGKKVKGEVTILIGKNSESVYFDERAT